MDRQLRLPGWRQDILKQSTVLIAGIGGLGVEIAKNLAMVGVGHLILIDMDTIEYSNLNRQILFIGAPEGSSKALFSAKKLNEINPHIKITAYHKPLQEVDPVVYQKADLFIAGLDSINARAELNRRAVHNNKILIDAGTAHYNGHVYCVFPHENACLDCDQVQEREREDLGACTLVGVPRKKSHCILKGKLKFEAENNGREPDIWNPADMSFVQVYCNNLVKEHFPNEKPYTLEEIIQVIDFHEPTVITINSVMASLQSQEAVKILHHIHSEKEKLGSLNKNYIIYNGLTGKFFEIEKPKNPNCLICGSDATPLFKVKVKLSFEIQKVIQKVIENKGLKIEDDFPPTLFRVDSMEGMEEIPYEGTIEDLQLRNFETILVTGLEEEKSFYLQINTKS
jgi:ubiquitin-activating enzyme E1 C